MARPPGQLAVRPARQALDDEAPRISSHQWTKERGQTCLSHRGEHSISSDRRSFRLDRAGGAPAHPAEIGLAVIGGRGGRACATPVRRPEFLIQRDEVKRGDITASFTVLFLMTGLMTAGVFALASRAYSYCVESSPVIRQ